LHLFTAPSTTDISTLSLHAALPISAAAEDYTLLGAGVRTRPDYDGSSSRTVDLIPVVRYYGKPWFTRTTQGMLEGGARYEFSPADRKSTRLNSSHLGISYAVFCLKK